MLSMKDKVAIVTGAGSIGPGWGNGKATATLLARQGSFVRSTHASVPAPDRLHCARPRSGDRVRTTFRPRPACLVSRDTTPAATAAGNCGAGGASGAPAHITA